MKTPAKQDQKYFVALKKAETVASFAKQAQEAYERYKSDREEIERSWKIADYMYQAAQNRALMSSEKSKGMNLEKDTRANTGSTIFHAQVNRLAALFVSICRSRPDLWRYETIGEQADDDVRAKVLQHLARFTRKADRIDKRLPELGVHIFKYSTCFAHIQQCRKYKRIMRTEPIYEDSPTEKDANGNPVRVQVDEKREFIEVVTDNFPKVEFLHNDRVFMDRWLPGVQAQNVSVVLSLRNRTEILGDVKIGYFQREAYDLIDETHEWNGTEGATLKQQELTNRQQSYSPSGKGLFLQWDLYVRAPIDEKGAWSDDNDPALWWGTVIGNTIEGGIMVRLERNPDPDDEIPIEVINVLPDNSDCIYHTANADVLRSLYSSDCTLLNLALDNMAVITNPPLTVIDGQHRIKDWRFVQGQRWSVDSHDVVKMLTVSDNTQSVTMLRDQIKAEGKTGIGTDDAMMGEYAGARTSASEYLGVSKNSRTPVMMVMDYILQQLFGWMGRKYKSHWQAYGPPPLIRRITDLEKQYPAIDSALQEESDIIVSIVDEYEDDMVTQQQAIGVLQVIGQVPAYQNSETHSIDMGELIKIWLNTMRWDTKKILGPPKGVDAQAAANHENSILLDEGIYVKPVDGENKQVHLNAHKLKRTEWRGMENSNDPRAKNLALLDQHIAETEASMQAQSANAFPSLAEPSGASTPGQIAGGEMGAAAGAASQGQIAQP